uniref:Uncharacterized protein n=1 Tax=Rhizophora mucronata TaxID=61149 RepID=A0A2P2QA63_RHIMU
MSFENSCLGVSSVFLLALVFFSRPSFRPSLSWLTSDQNPKSRSLEAA